MTVTETVIKKLNTFPKLKQLKVLDYVNSLESADPAPKPRRSLYGIWADLNVDLTEDDLRQARKEMWKNFPREHFYEAEKP